MIRDEDGAPTGYVYLDSEDKGLWRLCKPGEQGFEGEADSARWLYLSLGVESTNSVASAPLQRLKIILPIVFFLIFLLLYIIFKSATEAAVCLYSRLFTPCVRRPSAAMGSGLQLQCGRLARMHYIALFGIAVETGVVMVVYLHEALQHRLADGKPLTDADLEQATIDGAVQRLRPKLMTVTAVILSLAPILWESGIGSDVMKPIAAPIVGGMVTSTIHVLILVPVFFLLIKRREL